MVRVYIHSEHDLASASFRCSHGHFGSLFLLAVYAFQIRDEELGFN